MIYVTGDTHGNQEKWIHYIDPVLKENDILLVTGDFGLGFWYGKKYDEELWRKISENTHLFKLSWKQEYPTTIDGADTFYGKIINDSI